MHRVSGLHHITAIAGAPQENLDFYTGILGLRLVKRTVNQDEPSQYHFFYGDAEGHPGSSLTFFCWTDKAPARPGYGLAVETSLEVPAGSLSYWSDRLQKHGVTTGEPETRFGDRTLPVTDKHGLKVALVERATPSRRPFAAWDKSAVPARHQILGLCGARLWEQSAERTSLFLTRVLGLLPAGAEEGWLRSDRAASPDSSTSERPLTRAEASGARVPSIIWRGARETTTNKPPCAISSRSQAAA